MSDTPVTAANFVITGWGTGAAVSGLSGNQRRCRLTITAGPSPIMHPQVMFTYPDGPYPVPPLSVAEMVGGTGIVADIAIYPGSNQTAFNFQGLPVSGKTYILMFDTLGV